MSKPYKLMEKIKHASQSIYTLAALGVVATISGIATYHSVEEKMPAIDKAWYEMHELTQQAKEPKSLTCIIDQFQEKPYTVQKTVNGIRSILQLDEEDKDSLKRYADQLDEYLHYLTLLEGFVIKAYCIWCVSSAMIATMIFILVVTTLRRDETRD